jgi:hypothetical protein
MSDQPINSQITDAVTQTNVKVTGDDPAAAVGRIYQAMSHNIGVEFEKAVSEQQAQNTMNEEAANQGIAQIYSLDGDKGVGITETMAKAGVADNLSSLLTVLNAFKGGSGQP